MKLSNRENDWLDKSHMRCAVKVWGFHIHFVPAVRVFPSRNQRRSSTNTMVLFLFHVLGFKLFAISLFFLERRAIQQGVVV